MAECADSPIRWIMRYEVEQKFPVADLDDVQQRLGALGAAVLEERTESDVYYAHPGRDFAATDEALRIRRAGPSAWITYKGPKLDAATKTRREIDLPLPAGASPEAWKELLEALGFRVVAEVRKQRKKAWVDWQGRRVEVSLDRVEEVGTFVELELVTGGDDLAPARRCLDGLAAELNLSGSQRLSYLELLLARREAL